MCLRLCQGRQGIIIWRWNKNQKENPQMVAELKKQFVYITNSKIF